MSLTTFSNILVFNEIKSLPISVGDPAPEPDPHVYKAEDNVPAGKLKKNMQTIFWGDP